MYVLLCTWDTIIGALFSHPSSSLWANISFFLKPNPPFPHASQPFPGAQALSRSSSPQHHLFSPLPSASPSSSWTSMSITDTTPGSPGWKPDTHSLSPEACDSSHSAFLPLLFLAYLTVLHVSTPIPRWPHLPLSNLAPFLPVFSILGEPFPLLQCRWY